MCTGKARKTKSAYYSTNTQADQWRTGVITQVVSSNNCDLFLDILVIRMKQLDCCKIIQKNSDFVV